MLREAYTTVAYFHRLVASRCRRLTHRAVVVRSSVRAGDQEDPANKKFEMGIHDSATTHSSMSSLRVKKLSDAAVLPVRGSAGAAGYDLSSAHDLVVPARGKALAKTDLSIAIPLGTYARVAPRSGLAWKHSIDVGAGVVDYDYRGNVGVILFNFSDVDFAVKTGDRVAQLILERIETPPVIEVDDLDDTDRGSGGFGSTGGTTAQ